MVVASLLGEQMPAVLGAVGGMPRQGQQGQQGPACKSAGIFPTDPYGIRVCQKHLGTCRDCGSVPSVCSGPQSADSCSPTSAGQPLTLVNHRFSGSSRSTRPVKNQRFLSGSHGPDQGNRLQHSGVLALPAVSQRFHHG